MRRKIVVMSAFAFLAICLLFLTSCNGGAPAKPNGTPKPEPPGPGPGSFAEDFRESGKFFTNMPERQQGTSPHGWVQIWYSNNIKSLAGKDKFDSPVPVGTISIKPYIMEDREGIDGYAVMIKKEKGYDPENGDWHYEMRDVDGKLKEKPPAGKIRMCIECHRNYKETDYLAGTRMTVKAEEEKPPEETGGEVFDGEALVKERCTGCHPADRIYSHDKVDQARWKAIVDRMVGKGAKLSDAERKAVIDHLAGK